MRFADGVRRLVAGEVDLPAAGAAGRDWVVRHRDRGDAIASYQKVLDELVGARR